MNAQIAAFVSGTIGNTAGNRTLIYHQCSTYVSIEICIVRVLPYSVNIVAIAFKLIVCLQNLDWCKVPKKSNVWFTATKKLTVFKHEMNTSFGL